ncbi:hypothetical protein [Clostridioides difficile]|uniref:hypothetical protein n=1 Tax=Clostridioides difficile TaxID=1496 RepID=UPI00097FF39E|nr:hypothetical protein [Clostridioides difficile]MBY2230576.1 hypothetical protein [Clostridioides difficile]SJP04437.1 Uncharacterised protein [Clostridioides difficile]HBF4252765.1 hypothetical protein [Clostridioides difficile]HBF5909129.1 hypothetical protein [Clostridioides difficile]HBF6289608.1 hypothetical protein [Clostridioides difficile]
MFKKIYKHLKTKGFNVYSIGQHQGLCIEPFLVIFEKGLLQTTEKNIIKDLFEIYVFYPIGQYSKVSEYKISVESVMDEIVGIKQAYEALPILIDDEKQAYFTRLSYYENKQIRR